jgi:hypothetical protein
LPENRFANRACHIGVSFWREAHLHRKGHRDRPAGEDRHSIASRHVWDKQDSQRLQGGNNTSKARRFLNEGGNQPLLLNNDPEAKLLNLIGKGKIARETQATLKAAKAAIEAAQAQGIS